MFWNDPNLYGATFPYKDINTVQPPFALNPYDPMRRFMPQPYGFMPQPISFTPPTYGWLPPTYGLVPPYFNLQQNIDPMFYARTLNPFVQHVGLQQPPYNFYRYI